MEHRDARQHLGAYVLGALEPAERHEVEGHLADCPACRDELGSLSAVRPMLDRLDQDDVAVTVVDLPGAEALTRALGRVRGRERRRVRRWQAAAVAAGVAAAALGVLVVRDDGPNFERHPLAIREVTAAAASADGEVDAIPWEWGTTVALELTSLPRRDGYVVWVVAADGRREQAGAWGPTRAGGAVVRGASRIPTEQIDRVEITDSSGTLLLVFEPVRPAT